MWLGRKCQLVLWLFKQRFYFLGYLVQLTKSPWSGLLKSGLRVRLENFWNLCGILSTQNCWDTTWYHDWTSRILSLSEFHQYKWNLSEHIFRRNLNILIFNLLVGFMYWSASVIFSGAESFSIQRSFRIWMGWKLLSSDQKEVYEKKIENGGNSHV